MKARFARRVLLLADRCLHAGRFEKPCLAHCRSGSISHVLAGDEQTALRLGAALLVGAILGLNRELHGKPAGLRTHALVSLGAALAVVMILRLPDGSLSADPNAVSRVVQGILTGVGFLGAGVILHDPNGHISGLTTAATIWMCAVLGLVCGFGHWFVLGAAMALIAISLLFGRHLEHFAERLFKRHASKPPDQSV